MEFEIKTDLTAIPKAIAFNFDEMRSELTDKLNYYNSLVVTKDSIKDAKNDKAKLNKLKTAIEDKRKEVKKLCLAPYETFEKQCKELVGMIDQPIQAIDTQLKVFDDMEQQKKWQLIEEYYNAEVKELVAVAPLEKIISPKWKNKTESIETICNGIGDTLDRIRNEMETIKSLGSEFEQQILDCYLKDFSLSKAIAEHKRLEERKKQLEEIEKSRSARVTHAPAPEPEQIPASADQKYKVTFTVTGTKEEIKALGNFMKSNNINYEVNK